MSEPRSVVLDFDGVLVRSIEQHAESYRRTLAPYGLRVRDEDIFVREGGRSESIIEDLLRSAGHAVDHASVRRLADEKQRSFEALGPVHLYAGAEGLVRRLRAAAAGLGLVTGTRRANLERLIPHLLPLFDAVLAQEHYGHDKPHPEPYAAMARALGVAGARCAALENAPLGVQSAKAAGYGFVVGITTTVDAAALADADAVVSTHEEAARRLEAWVRG